MVKSNGLWCCMECDYTSTKSSNMREHIDSKHTGDTGVTCKLCTKVCASIGALRKHTAKYHK